MGERSDGDKNRRLLRFVAMLVMWPSWSTAAGFAWAGVESHLEHFLLFVAIGLAGLALYFAAPRLASGQAR